MKHMRRNARWLLRPTLATRFCGQVRVQTSATRAHDNKYLKDARLYPRRTLRARGGFAIGIGQA